MLSIKLLATCSSISFRVSKRIFASQFMKLESSFCKIRYLSTSSTLKYLEFKHSENDFAHKIMERNIEKYNLAKKIEIPVSSISKDEFDHTLQENWSDRKPEELISVFEKLSDFAYCNKYRIDSIQLDSFVDALADNMPNMNDDQLDSICRNLLKWPEAESVATRNFVEIWGSLDDALLNKMGDWDVEKMLLFADNMYNLYLTRKSDYVWKALWRLNHKVLKMSPQQFVQSMFHVGTCRRSSKFMYDYEIQFCKLFNQFSIDELGVISVGFFKSKTPLRNEELVDLLIQRVIEEANNIHEITLCSILKIIRYSSKLGNLKNVRKMLDVLEPTIPRHSLFCCLQIVLVGTKINLFHPEALTAVAEKFNNDPSSARLKDIERLAFVYSEFNFRPKTTVSVFDSLLNELRRPERKQEIHKHGKSLLRTLSFLMVLEIYPADLIHKAFEKDFFNFTYGKNIPYYVNKNDPDNAIREIIVMKYSIDIELRDYNGNKVDNKICKGLVKKFTDYVPEPGGKYSLNILGKQMLEMILLLKKMRNGDPYVHGDHLLPHFQTPDIVICNDVNNKPVAVTRYFPSVNFGNIQPAPDNVNKWFAFVIVGKYTLITNTRSLLGTTVMKLRQLKKIGYKPLVVTWHGWKNLKTEEEKIRYLTNVINNYDEDDDYMRISMH